MWQANDTSSIAVCTPAFSTMSSTVETRQPVLQVKALPGSRISRRRGWRDLKSRSRAISSSQVVFGVGHQVPAAHVEPPDPVEILPEMLFDGFQRQLQVVRARLAQHVEVQPVDPGGKIVQFIGRNAEARAGGHKGL